MWKVRVKFKHTISEYNLKVRENDEKSFLNFLKDNHPEDIDKIKWRKIDA